MAGLLCFGHRGACGHEPENTLRSMRKALALGADGVELDIHLAGGRLMVIHDKTLDRTTNGKGWVAKKSFDQLRSLDAGRGERIPTLEEVIDTVNRRAIVNVELKGAGTAGPVAELIADYVKRGWQLGDFLVSSFDYKQLEAAKAKLPSLRIGVLGGRPSKKLLVVAERLGAWSVHVSARGLKAEWMAGAHGLGLKVFVYTVNQPKEITGLQKLGVDGVFSDYPDRVVNLRPVERADS